MRLLVVHAHPDPESFNAALCREAVAVATGRGHEVRVLDLHAEGFNPVMTTAEWRGYGADGPVPDDLQPHIKALLWAEGLLFVYPTWWLSPPAILKGWMDRVWRPGIAFLPGTADEPLRGALLNVRLIGVISTFGAPWWFWTFIMAAPGRKIMLRGLRQCAHPKARTFWLGLYDMEAQTDASRQRFLRKVRARIARIPV